MKTLNLGIVLEAGADFSLIVGIFGMSGPTNIDGYEFLGQMKSSTDPTATVIAEFDFAILDQSRPETVGQFMWSLPASVTSEIVTSVSNSLQKNRMNTPYIFDVKMKDTSGKISRIIQGIVCVSPEATQESFS